MVLKDVRKALKIFLRWRLGKAKAMYLAGWLDIFDLAAYCGILADSHRNLTLGAHGELDFVGE